MSKKQISDAVEILDHRYRETVPDWDDAVAEEDLKMRVGIAIIQLRKDASLTQKQLAERMAITQAMVSQLENADYEGSALDMLWRACKALHIGLDLICKEPNTQRNSCEVSLTSA
jgi:predicted XRE-type DNA-binding protein